MYTYLAAFLAGCIMAGAGTWKVQGWRFDSKEKERIEASQEMQRINAKAANSVSADHEGFMEKERVVYKTITRTVDKIVDRPIYSNVCFDADGLRELNSAIIGADASKP